MVNANLMNLGKQRQISLTYADNGCFNNCYYFVLSLQRLYYCGWRYIRRPFTT